MKIYFPSVFTLVCGVFLVAACSQKDNDPYPVPELSNLTVTHSMKGWELYSWPEGNNWKFSFLIGTNRTKTFSEVTSSDGSVNLIRVTGVDSAKIVLNKFSAGEYIMLLGLGWLQNRWEGQYGNLRLPPQSLINELKSFSQQKQLTFTVAN